MDLLTRQDVDNIKRSFQLEIQDGVRHNNDAVSVDLWVAECRGDKSEFNPILFYKQQGQSMQDFQDFDFCLIIMNDIQASLLTTFGTNIIAIDGTHGLNNYDFEMTTIMIVDDCNEGFPVSFMFTNRKDTFIQQIFFNAVKEKVGVIACKVFMSDITSVYYNAWIQVMGAVPQQLYCSWHVDRAWNQNLSKIQNKETRDLVYKTIKFLQTSTDINTSCFKKKLSVAVEHMLQDHETRDFGVYFNTYYVGICEKWAYCYRKECGINTNMRLESMHKVIKYFYLDGKCVKRLDKGLHATLRYVRDKIIGRIIQHTKGKQSIHSRRINQRHRLALTSSFNISAENNQTWIVSSSEKDYSVTKNIELTSKCCNLVCQFCNICIHSFTCNCPDFFMMSTICKHIHYVVYKTDKQLTINRVQLMEVNKETAVGVEHCMNYLSKSNPTVNSDTIKSNLLTKLSALQTKVHLIDISKMEDCALSQVMSHLNNIDALLQLKRDTTFDNNFTSVSEVSPNKTINPQLRFISTKRKRHRGNDKTIKKPNKDEVKAISNLLNGSNMYVSTDPNTDHNYTVFNTDK